VKGISAGILLVNRYNFIKKMKVKIMRKKGERKEKKEGLFYYEKFTLVLALLSGNACPHRRE